MHALTGKKTNQDFVCMYVLIFTLGFQDQELMSLPGDLLGLLEDYQVCRGKCFQMERKALSKG